MKILSKKKLMKKAGCFGKFLFVKYKCIIHKYALINQDIFYLFCIICLFQT